MENLTLEQIKEKYALKNKYLTYLTLAQSCYGSSDINLINKYVEYRTIGLKLKKEFEDKYEKRDN